MIFLVERFQFLILRGESAASGGVHDKHDSPAIVGERDFLAHIILYLDVIDALSCCGENAHNSHKTDSQ